MMVDGEWRVAFLAADHKGLSYGTRTDAGRAQEPVRRRLHQRDDHRHPEGGKNTDQAWNLVKYLTTNTTPGHVLQRDPQRAVDGRGRDVEGAQARPNFATFTKIFVHPKSATVPVTPLGRRTSRRSRASRSGRPAR